MLRSPDYIQNSVLITVLACWFRVGLYNIKGESLLDYFYRVGPSPRHCFRTSQDTDLWDMLLHSMYKEIFRFASQKSLVSEWLVFSQTVEPVAGLPWSILTIEPMPHNESLCMTSFVSDWARDMFLKLVIIYRLDLYTMREFQDAMGNPQTKTIAGKIFEASAHSTIMGTTLPMRPLLVSGTEPVTDQEQAPIVHLKIPGGGDEPGSDVREPVMMSFSKSKTPKLLPGNYYIPTAANQAAFDSLVIVGNDVYLLQMTVGHKHGIKISGLETLHAIFERTAQHLLPRPDKQWHIVFIIPPSHQGSFTLQELEKKAGAGKTKLGTGTEKEGDSEDSGTRIAEEQEALKEKWQNLILQYTSPFDINQIVSSLTPPFKAWMPVQYGQEPRD